MIAECGFGGNYGTFAGAYGNVPSISDSSSRSCAAIEAASRFKPFRQEIHATGLPAAIRRLADDQLNLAAPFIDDSRRLGDLLGPGDLRPRLQQAGCLRRGPHIHRRVGSDRPSRGDYSRDASPGHNCREC